MSEGSGQRSVSSVLESNKFGRYDKMLQLRSGRTVPRRACVVTLSCKDLFLFKSASTSKLGSFMHAKTDTVVGYMRLMVRGIMP